MKAYALPLAVLFSLLLSLGFVLTVSAQPYGVGLYSENVPYGGATTMTISASNVGITLTPLTSGAIASSTADVTVASTDVVGFMLYVRALGSTNMAEVTSGALLPASANVSPNTLTLNTWGYNLDGSTLFAGITSTDVLIKSVTGPAASGDITSVTYG